MDNPEPTTCINRILENNGKSHITAEQLIVTILEKFAKNLEILEEKGWENGLAKVYYTHWEDQYDFGEYFSYANRKIVVLKLN